MDTIMDGIVKEILIFICNICYTQEKISDNLKVWSD